jgi:predicted porin
MRKRSMKGLLILLFFTLVFSQTVFAEDIPPIYKFPDIKPQFSVRTGYRLVGLTGSKRAGEHEHLSDSVSFGGEIIAFPFPHRIHLEVDVVSGMDYFGDLSYAYKDIVLSRWINSTLFHNLDNITLVDLDPSTASPGVSIKDAGVSYGVKTSINDLFLRLKTHNFPFHVYVNGRILYKEGTMQQRFLGGSGWFNDIVRVSRKRDVNWNTQDITFGMNSHLGPIEIDISHTEKRFDSNADRVLIDTYTGAGFPPGAVRAAGDYPHNLVPDLEGSTNTLKLHTSYTGKIVASLTISKTDRENNDSGAKADYFTSTGEIRWMPITRLTFAFKYKREETDMDNPSTLTDGYYGLSTNPTTITGITPSISSKTDTFSGSMRYRLTKKVTLNLRYIYKEIDRDNADAWEVPDSTTENTISLSANARLKNGMKLKARYKHREIDNPAYNTQPNRSDSGMLSLSWTPFEKLVTFFSYNIAREKRTGITYKDMYTANPENRDVNRNKFTGSLTFLIKDNITLTTSYAYLHNKVEQDFVYNDADDAPDYTNEFLDPGVQYKDIVRNYVVDLNYAPKENISLNVNINHTKSSGNFYPDTTFMPSLSELKLRETVYSVSAEYGLKDGWDIGIRCRYIDLDNLSENPDNPEISDGTVRIALLTVSKRW